MKSRLLILIFIFVVPFGVTSAQTLRIVGKKVTYTRVNPRFDFKRTFTINYPKVKSVNRSVSRRIENILSYESVLGLKLEDELDKNQWLQKADYRIQYNNYGILCIELWIEGLGAYSSAESKIVSVNSRLGRQLRPSDVFTNTFTLAPIVRRAQLKEKRSALDYINRQEPDADEPELLFGDRQFEVSDLAGFEVRPRGLIFHYKYNFPHSAILYEPAGEYFYTWKQLKRFIKKEGLLGQFIR